MSTLDVTPVGATTAVVRRRRPVLLALGVVLLAAGLALTGAGIVRAVGDAAALEDDAVARGIVAAGAGAVTFTVPGTAKREYSVYLKFDGVTSSSTRHEAAVADTVCLAALPGGGRTTIRGARQGASLTLGDASSVGHFAAPSGDVAVVCAFARRTRSSAIRRPARVPYLVTPGTPSGLYGSVGLIVGGTAAGLLGGFLTFRGWRGRRRIGARA